MRDDRDLRPPRPGDHERGEPAPAREEERERGRESDETAPKPEVSEQRQNGGRIKASPLARRIARERGVELAGLRGTGPEGRIVAEDVERAAASGAITAPAAAGPAAIVPHGDVVEFVESALELEVSMIGTGADRESVITRDQPAYSKETGLTAAGLNGQGQT